MVVAEGQNVFLVRGLSIACSTPKVDACLIRYAWWDRLAGTIKNVLVIDEYHVEGTSRAVNHDPGSWKVDHTIILTISPPCQETAIYKAVS